MKPEESIMSHARAKGATLEEGTQPSLVLCLQVVPLESAAFFEPARRFGITLQLRRKHTDGVRTCAPVDQ